MSIENNQLKNVLEASLMSVSKPMSVEQLMTLFTDDERPSASKLRSALQSLQQDCEGRGIELKEVASGFRYQARQDYAEWISRLWEERPAKYSRAFLETLALIAYRQPVTRGEIEDVRGVGVSSNIIKTMLEREWIRVVGHRDVPGRPSLYATTRQFLDYFNMKSLDELPSLAEIKDLEDLNPELGLSEPGQLDEEQSPAQNSNDSDEVFQSDSEDRQVDSDLDNQIGLLIQPENIALESQINHEDINQASLENEPHIDKAQADDESLTDELMDVDAADKKLNDIESTDDEQAETLAQSDQQPI